ncbi:unnamed protein product [marine sediment metagenome]|uniref:Uncharacterized protein n=1 Tax=marine sediment metagenome TaxID=412755 RepID=X1T891_9ZZZZ
MAGIVYPLGFDLNNLLQKAFSPQIEIGTKKEQITTTQTYAPTITRTFDIQYIHAQDEAVVSTKKEQALTQSPYVAPSVSPILSSELLPSTTGKGGFDIQGILITALVIGGSILLAPVIIKAIKKK